MSRKLPLAGEIAYPPEGAVVQFDEALPDYRFHRAGDEAVVELAIWSGRIVEDNGGLGDRVVLLLKKRQYEHLIRSLIQKSSLPPYLRRVERDDPTTWVVVFSAKGRIEVEPML